MYNGPNWVDRTILITEHSRRITVARGLDAKRLLNQVEEIRRLNRDLKGIVFLKGIVVHVLENGDLDLPADVLGQLDIVVGADHSRFNLFCERQTARILKAMDHAHCHVPPLGTASHQAGTLRGGSRAHSPPRERERFFPGLNAHSERLNLVDLACRMARDAGKLVSIDSYAHTIDDFNNLRFGMGQARIRRLEKPTFLIARPLCELRPLPAGTIEVTP
ncbi:MAG: hypothetical protein ACHRXM_06365 [Isosphaerales bacterium]